MSHLRRIIPVALAIVASAAPAAQAKLDDPSSYSNVARPAQDLRAPDTRDAAGEFTRARQDLRAPDTLDLATGYTPALRQDLRAPDTRDAAAARAVPSETGQGTAFDAMTWALIAFAVVACSVALGAVARSRRTRVPA